MAMLTEELNRCDLCGTSFSVNDVDGVTGTIRVPYRPTLDVKDFCPTCTKTLKITTCGGCGEIMQWDDLSADYECSTCEKSHG